MPAPQYDVDRLAVTVTHELTGPVVRWHHDAEAVMYNRVLIQASRDGVRAHGYLVPALFDRAWAASVAIARGHDVDHLATHKRVDTPMGVLVEPITAVEAHRG